MDTNFLNPVFSEYKTYYLKANEKFDFNNKKTGEKLILKLNAQIGELASSSNAFVFSNNKKTDKEDVVEKISACILTLFNFLYQLNEKLEDVSGEQEFSLVEEFLFTINESSFLIYDFEKTRVKSILANILKIGKLLRLNNDDILNACYVEYENKLKEL